jgi:hypothetical protein
MNISKSYDDINICKPEQELTLEIPKQAREIGINRITIDKDEIIIYYLHRFIAIPRLESKAETYDIVERRCKLFRLSTEVVQWIVVLVQLELEKEISN